MKDRSGLVCVRYWRKMKKVKLLEQFENELPLRKDQALMFSNNFHTKEKMSFQRLLALTKYKTLSAISLESELRSHDKTMSLHLIQAFRSDESDVGTTRCIN
ncbi:uncharacterized protein LOC132066096 [Lycium ferocissimum]|uniref:uncharacterized protein LOC132066096 n=1 Tax=Lycium ferocissimum TaxID=112874 RepID=UPI0028157958|nr:uncharacterized protein LOC132066096 [Lycium ferocissimum]